jgi:hypothetical protein
MAAVVREPQEGLRRHKLLTKEILNRIPALRGQEGLGEDAIVHVKFFSPYSGWTWYATEYDPADGTFFGYVVGFEAEWGYFSFEELAEARFAGRVPAVERDCYFDPAPVREFLR